VDLELLREQLRQTERLVEQAEMQVLQQMHAVGQLAGRSDLAGARDLLTRFQDIRDLHVAERDALRKAVADFESRGTADPQNS
jgi:hypothetical protein